MKKIFLRLLVLTLTIFVSSCKDDDTNNLLMPSLTLIADSYTISDGETVNFTVYQNGFGNEDITSTSTIKADGAIIPNNGTYQFVFVPNEENTNTSTTYKINATKDNLFSPEIRVIVRKTGIQLTASKTEEGSFYEGDNITFAVTDATGNNVTESGTSLTIKYTKEDGIAGTTVLENQKDYIFENAGPYPGIFTVLATYNAPNGTIVKSTPLLDITINRKYDSNSNSYIDLVTTANTLKNVVIKKVEVIHDRLKDAATTTNLSSEYIIKITGNDNKITLFTIQLENPLSAGAIPVLNTGSYAYIPLGTKTGFKTFSYDNKTQNDLTLKGKEAVLNISAIDLEAGKITLRYQTGLITSGTNQAIYEVNYDGKIIFTTLN